MEMFIADTHFGHENILEECRTHFRSVEEMDERILENINRKMNKSDTLYILGDFSFRSKRDPREYLEAIRPKKVLILGNHDRDWLRHLSEEEKARYFLGIHEQFSLKRNGIELHLCHFPRLAWSRSHYFAQSLSLCGHIHDARDTTPAARLFPLVPCQYNVGVDVNGFEPVTLAETVANNNAFYGRRHTAEEAALLQSAVEKLTL